MDYKWIFAVVAVLILILVLYGQEHFDSYDPKDTNNYIRLYETFTLRPNPPDARWWEFAADGKARIKKALKMQLKSYDIKVRKGRVQLWAIYPGEVMASSSALGVSGYGDAYNDAMPLLNSSGKDPEIQVGELNGQPLLYNPPGWQHTYTTDAYRANSPKYQLIAEARSGDRIKGTLDYKCTRVMVIANFD